MTTQMTAVDLPAVVITTEEQFNQLNPGKPFADIYVARHHQTLDNINKIWAGNKVNSHLTPAGMEQAKEAAQALHQKLGAVHAIYASDTFRSQESAEPFAELCKLPCQTIGNFHESDHGSLTGLTEPERKAVMAKDPYYAEQKQASRLEKFYKYPVALDAELAFHAAERVLNVITEMGKKHPGQKVVLFGHGGPMQKLKYTSYIQQFEQKKIQEVPEDVDNPKHGEVWHLKVSDRQIFIIEN